MGIAALQALKVGSYIFKQKLKGNKQYPLVLMLEPLFRCNLACVGCGKIQYPGDILKKNMTPQQAFRAIDECGAPVVTIAGGEPLMHPEIDVIAKGMIARKKFVYLCTNAILLEKNLHRFEPSPYLTFNVHLDGMREQHDRAVDRKGIFDVAVSAIKKAKAAGFRVNTNTTVFDGETPEDLHEMFDMLTELGVDGMTIAPGYGYEKAPDQDHFLTRQETNKLFQQVLAPMASPAKGRKGKKWQFNQSPLYLKFLMGEIDYECTPWGSPNYNIFGWQKPCYMFSDGYATTFSEYLQTTDWSKYGRKSGNPKCQDCMMHCGHEPTAAIDATSSLRGMLVSIKGLA